MSRTSTAYPSEKLFASLLGFWITLLIATLIWVAVCILARMPLPWVTLNFLLTPSKATFKVWEVPEPTPVKLIAVKLAALVAEVASLIVCAVS